jgi:broad specificity phosphatase PhoE
MQATVFLVRHATPDWSRTDIRYDIPPGPPLTPQGEQEAALLGEFLAAQGVVRVYASPLERTLRTAALASHALRAIPEQDDHLAEWRHGEGDDNVLARFRPRLDHALDESSRTGPVALVTHGGPIRLLLTEFGLDHAEVTHFRRQFDHDNPVPPAGVWRISRDHAGRFLKPELVHTPQGFQPYSPPTIQV